MRAETACAASGMIAPASSSAPCRAGRQSAASTATTTTATMTATFPAITRPGLLNALPSRIVFTVPSVACATV